MQQVCNEIRWKKAHDVVREELLAHIEDQREAYMMDGIPELEADALAVEEMGDPLEIGNHFDKVYRPHIEWNVILFVGVIIAVGLFIRLSLMRAAGLENTLLEDIAPMVVGLVVLVYGYLLDYGSLFYHYFSDKTAGIIWTAICTSVLFYLITGEELLFGYGINGENPAMTYLALLWILVLCAFVCMQYQKGTKGYGYSYLFLLFSLCFFSGTTAGFLLILGTGIVLLGYALNQNWFGCDRKWWVTLSFLPLALIVLLLQSPWRMSQFIIALNPASDPMGYGYSAIQVMTVLEEAQLFGAGGKDLFYAVEYVPALMTDHILTAAVAHWGWISLIPIVAAYGMMFYLAVKASYRVKSRIGKMLLVTVGAAWMIQLLLYFCMNFTTLQISCYPLLFVQSNQFNMFLLGLVLSVYKTGAVQKDVEPLYKQAEKNN